MEQQRPRPFYDRPITEKGMPNAGAVEELMEKRNLPYGEAEAIVNGAPNEESPSRPNGSSRRIPNTRGGRSYTDEISGREASRRIAEEAAKEAGPWTEEDRTSTAMGLAAIRNELRNKEQG